MPSTRFNKLFRTANNSPLPQSSPKRPITPVLSPVPPLKRPISATRISAASWIKSIKEPSPSSEDPNAETVPLLSERLSDERTPDVNREFWGRYFAGIWQGYLQGRAETTRELRVIAFEVFDHLDWANDSLLLSQLAVSCVLGEAALRTQAALILLTGVFINSLVGYSLRGRWIAHEITDKWLFFPFVVFSRIKQFGQSSHENIIMMERAQWTYVIVMRLLEDLPQIVIVALLLSEEGDALFLTSIAFSLLAIIFSSVRLGAVYPYRSTLSFMICTDPPLTSANLAGAAPTTPAFFLYISFCFLVSAISTGFCTLVYQQELLMNFLFKMSSSSFLMMSFLACLYWTRLLRQVKQNEDNTFRVMPTV